MSQSLAWAELDDKYNDTEINKTSNRSKHKKTYKKRTSGKAKQFLNSLPKKQCDDEDSDDESGLGAPYENTHGQNNAHVAEQFGLLREGLDQRKEYDKAQNSAKNAPYYNQYVPSYTGTTQNIPYYSQLLNSNNLQGQSQDELMKKLNYVVHLLEEQHDEKTGSVTEELVLYMFLGVFVIFVVDSFSKSSKYKR